jgi:hypothetical protein
LERRREAVLDDGKRRWRHGKRRANRSGAERARLAYAAK